MKLFVGGIILVSIAVLSLIGNFAVEPVTNDPGGAILGFLMFAGGGSLMIYFGKKGMNIRKRVLEFAFAMLRKEEAIDAGEISGRLGLSEIKVRDILRKEQLKGVIPFKAEIK
ncbi:MAG: hypothetical protein J7L64_03040 [Acidobacteria bacterium]|nr:hypothetical protein [Acidobacteriota bacterium]